MAVWKRAALASVALTALLASNAAQARPRAGAGRASVERAPAATFAPPSYTPVARPTQPPVMALRPEFSEGEWSDLGGREQLDPAALADSAAPVDKDGGRLATARIGSSLSKISDRQLQGAPMPTSRLDEPLGGALAGPVTVPVGFNINPSGFTFTGAAGD